MHNRFRARQLVPDAVMISNDRDRSELLGRRAGSMLATPQSTVITSFLPRAASFSMNRHAIRSPLPCDWEVVANVRADFFQAQVEDRCGCHSVRVVIAIDDDLFALAYAAHDAFTGCGKSRSSSGGRRSVSFDSKKRLHSIALSDLTLEE